MRRPVIFLIKSIRGMVAYRIMNGGTVQTARHNVRFGLSSFDIISGSDMPLKNRFLSYSRFIKAEHTLFSIPLVFSGAILAGRRLPSWPLWGLLLGAGFGARTTAFALNRI